MPQITPFSSLPASDRDLLASVACGQPISLRSLPSLHWEQWVTATAWSLRLLRAFERGGSEQAYRLLNTLNPRTLYGVDLSPSLRLVQARQHTALLRAWIHLVGKPHHCFGESFALCAGLRRLGYDCHLLVGCAQIEQFVETPLHAWVSYQDEPLNSSLEVLYGYQLMYCDGKPVSKETNGQEDEQ